MTRLAPQLHDHDDDWLDAMLRRDAVAEVPDQGFSVAVLQALPPPRRAALSNSRAQRVANALLWLNPLMAGAALAAFLWALPGAVAWLQGVPSMPGLPGLGVALEHLLPSLVPLLLLCWWSLNEVRSDSSLGL